MWPQLVNTLNRNRKKVVIQIRPRIQTPVDLSKENIKKKTRKYLSCSRAILENN